VLADERVGILGPAPSVPPVWSFPRAPGPERPGSGSGSGGPVERSGCRSRTGGSLARGQERHVDACPGRV
jgi:hypothetical protein